MPLLATADLKPLLEGDPAELEGRISRVLGSLGCDPALAPALLAPVLALRERATRFTPPPTDEELSLGLLAIVAAHGRRR